MNISLLFFFSSRRRHTRCALVTGVQTCALPIYREVSLRHYRQLKPDWIIFGNHYASLDELPTTTRSALLYHGIGIKSCYYDRELADMDLRFVEGPFRLAELQRRHPQSQFCAKNGSASCRERVCQNV